MKTNEELQNDVQAAIKWESLLSTSDIGVVANSGIITLSGSVDSYSKKIAAENAAKSIKGVKAVVEKLKIEFSSWNSKSDIEIAAAILNAIKWNWEVLNDNVKVKVEDGWVTLDGTLQWNYEKEAAQRAVSNLTGVRGITNNILIQPESGITVSQKDIEMALKRNIFIDPSDIDVEVYGNNATLKGSVDSWYQKNLAGKIAWNTPGIVHVNNELDIEYKGIAHLIDAV